MTFVKVCSVFFVIILGVIAGKDSEEERKGFFQYANVPGKSEHEFGYNRGNVVHQTSRFEQVNDSKFRTKVKWSDAYEGQGEHFWEYNHGTGHEISSPSYSSAEIPSSLQAPEHTYPAPTPAPAPSHVPSTTKVSSNSAPAIASDEEHEDEPAPVYVPKRQRSPSSAAPLPSYPKAAVPPYKPKKPISYP